MRSFLKVLLLAAVAAASPVQELDARNAPRNTKTCCSKVTSTVAAGACQAKASAFCTGYNHVSAPTVMVSKTTTHWNPPSTQYNVTATQTVTSRTCTRTQYVTTTPTTTVVTTSTVTIRSGQATQTSTSTVTAKTYPANFTCTVQSMNLGPAPMVTKRANQPPAAPRCLAAYPSGSALSSACSCLATTPAPVTQTAVVTVTSAETIVVPTERTVGADTTKTVTVARVAAPATVYNTTYTTTTVPTTTVTAYATTTKASGEYSRYLAIRTSPDGNGQTAKYLVASPQGGVYYAEFSQQGQQGQPFFLDDSCRIVNASSINSGAPSYFSQSTNATTSGDVFFAREGYRDVAPVTCLVDTKTGSLQCTNYTTRKQDTQVCSNDYEHGRWYLGAAEDPRREFPDLQCSNATLVAEFAVSNR